MMEETELEQIKEDPSSDKEGEEDDKSQRSDAGSQKSDGDEEMDAEDIELSTGAGELKDLLDQITVEAPTAVISPSDIFDPEDFPESYKELVPKEKLVQGYAENFRRQYVHLYRDRKPLFLTPVNECNIEKFVCTTIRPTQLSYRELYDWDGAAEFVADYLNFVTIDPPHKLPTRLLSPSTILKRQKANCFEYSTLLASFLIAAGYDAYVVSGYATKEVCLMDEAREICPLLKKEKETKVETEKQESKKYTVRPPKDLRSKFILKQERRREEAAEKEEQKNKTEEEERQLELEKPPPDSLYGLRIHSWVLVLSGKREVPESFFIEPLTGLSQPVNCENYLGIESVWNHQNYWVNMQDCSEGVKNLNYDLGDCCRWEFMFPGPDKPLLILPEDEKLDMDDEDDDEEVEKFLDMPPSWVEPIDISLKDFQMRCPLGKKTKLYKRARLEKFAHYLMKDGLVSRLSVYQDRELQDLVCVKEFYAHREDKLEQRIHNHRTGWITEHYLPGRSRSLKEHQYLATSPGPENDRVMIFYHEARVDGLQKRVESPTEMTEHFTKRDDFLYYRHVVFSKRPKKFGPKEGTSIRPILKMIERYRRNVDKDANEDIAEMVFLMSEERVQLTYHTKDDKISASTRELIKPTSAEKGSTVIWHPDNHTTFQVDQRIKDKKKVELYDIMVELLKAETRCEERVRESEVEVEDILNDRTKEEIASEMEVSVYDTQRNEKAKKHRQELERLLEEEKMRRQELELDYLAPFLAQIGDPTKFSRQQAYKLKEDCLADLKQRLIDKANLIQSRFEKETQELQKKQAWYQQNQVSMQKDDEEGYLSYCSEAMFRIHILELRLNRHKDMAPQKYMALEQKIRADNRLSDFF